MKRILFLWVILISLQAFSQEDAWVYFNAKPNAQAFFNNPLSELSQRSLDRRAAQNITLDIHDAPMHQPYIDQIVASNGIAVMAKSKWFNALHIQGSFEDISALNALPFVDHLDFANRALNGASKSTIVHKHKKIKKSN